MNQKLSIKNSVTDKIDLMFPGENQEYRVKSSVEVKTVEFEGEEDWCQNFLNNLAVDKKQKVFPSIYYLQFTKDLNETNRRLDRIISKYEV